MEMEVKQRWIERGSIKGATLYVEPLTPRSPNLWAMQCLLLWKLKRVIQQSKLKMLHILAQLAAVIWSS